jgi:hypothetical protein
LRPVDYDELTEAVDLLEHFQSYWDESGKLPNPPEARQQLVTKVIDRVLVYDDEIVAVVLHGSFAVVLDQNQMAPALLVDAVLFSTRITAKLPCNTIAATSFS